MTDTTPFTDKQWGGVPEYMRGSLARYIQHGIEPGSFLSAVLCNDLRAACAAADDVNRQLLFAYVQFLYCHAPGACWGTPQRFDAWMDEHASARRQAEKAKQDQRDSAKFGVGA